MSPDIRSTPGISGNCDLKEYREVFDTQNKERKKKRVEGEGPQEVEERGGKYMEKTSNKVTLDTRWSQSDIL